MNNKGIKAEDLYPEGVDYKKYNGISVRKGMMAAIVANIQKFESSQATSAEKIQALEQIKEYAPSIIAVGLHGLVTWKNPIIQKIFDDAQVN